MTENKQTTDSLPAILNAVTKNLATQRKNTFDDSGDLAEIIISALRRADMGFTLPRSAKARGPINVKNGICAEIHIPDHATSGIPDQCESLDGNSKAGLDGNNESAHDWNCESLYWNYESSKAKVIHNFVQPLALWVAQLLSTAQTWNVYKIRNTLAMVV